MPSILETVRTFADDCGNEIVMFRSCEWRKIQRINVVHFVVASITYLDLRLYGPYLNC